MLYDYILNKLSKTYEDDKETLSKAVAKLLYFNISKENIELWEDYYFPPSTDLSGINKYMNCGIPQGLPQSYFFGNLCMIEVKNILMQDKAFRGDAYFYVDDSVIYIKSKLNSNDFKEKLQYVNKMLEVKCQEVENAPSTISTYIDESYLDIQKIMDYKIVFHEEGKSTFTHIDDKSHTESRS